MNNTTKKTTKEREKQTTHRAYVGIIGGGFGGLMTYIVLRFKGLPADQIAVFSTSESPRESWAKMAHTIKQREMRSESLGHFYPTDSPGLATMTALKEWSPKPIVLSWFDQFRPSVDSMLTHIDSITHQTGFWSSLHICAIDKVLKHDNQFYIHDKNGNLCSVVQHLVIATGHGQRSIPSVIEEFWREHPKNKRVVHAFDPKPYRTKETVIVLGDGLTAATEWDNILTAGSQVLAISRNGFIQGQPLNTPRRYFSQRGLKPYRNQSNDRRLSELKSATRGTIPNYPHWNRLFKEAENADRLQKITGELLTLDQSGSTLIATVQNKETGINLTITADRLICATGFQPASTNPLLQQIIADHNLATINGHLIIDNTCTIPELSSENTIAAVVGQAAVWAIPCADSLSGMKMAARKIANRIMGPDTWHPSELVRKTDRFTRLVRGKSLA